MMIILDQTKDIIDEHKKGDNPLSPKAYSLIEGSMRNWDSAAGDKVKALFHKFDEILITSRSFNIAM